MSRQFKARDKKHQKMKRDGLVERNAATGEEIRVSERNEDFTLRQGQPNELPRLSRDEPKPSIRPRQRQIYEQPADTRTDTAQASFVQNNTGQGKAYTLETPTSEPSTQDTTEQIEREQPFEVARPTTRSYEARSYEKPSGGKPSAGQIPLRHSGGTTPKQQPPPTAAPVTEKQPDIPTNNTGAAERAGRLQFDKTPEQAAPGTKPRQKGTEYSQRFVPDAAQPQKPPTVATDTTAETTTPPDVTTDSAGAAKHTGRLQFDKAAVNAAPDTKPKQKGTQYSQRFASDAAQPEKPSDQQEQKHGGQTAPNGDKPEKKPSQRETEQPTKLDEKPGKLQFSKDEQTPAAVSSDKKLTKLKEKTERTNGRLEAARDKLPDTKREKKALFHNDKKGKAKRKIQFANEELPPGAKRPLKDAAPVSLVRNGTETVKGKLHQKVYEVEHENVGVEAGHRIEQVAEGAYRGGKRVTRSAYRFVKNKPYRTVASLEKKAAKANIKYAYRTALRENPKLKSSIISRYMQKRKIKQQYAKAARDAKKAANAAKKTGSAAANAVKAVAGVIKRHPVAASLILLILLVVLLFSTLFTSCASMGGGGFTGVLASSYLAEDADIDNAELHYTEWETDLEMQINRTEQDYPGYDEYCYQVDNIGHNPYELIAYLTATHQYFQYASIQAELQQLFGEQYSLSVVPSVETRYADPTDANDDGDYEPYDWHILTVSLTSRPFTDIIMPRMNAEQQQNYALLMQTKGNRQYLYSPFDFNWLPYVTSYYGYRIHPISSAKDYHKGIDIGVPTGTDIRAGQDGTVTFAGWDSGYGYYVVLDDGKGFVSKYAHCDSLLVSTGQSVKTGDVIAKSGNTGSSTGPHLHMEVIKDGQYLNPLIFAQTNDTGSMPVYGVPGSPMGDGSYAALIAEAERHLGKPYVWGASGPNSFDCSGFVSAVLNNSGVANVGRLTASGLYNICTPVSPADAKPGDLIYFHSTYSTASTITHIGIYVGNGMMIHAGSPVQYTSINTTYWQTHFYAFARLN